MPLTLNFSLLDDLMLAWEKNRRPFEGELSSARIEQIGPLVELGILRKGGIEGIPPLDQLPVFPASQALQRALGISCDQSETPPNDEIIEFCRTLRIKGSIRDEIAWDQFCERAANAAQKAGFSRITAAGLVGALMELEDNIHLHSDKPRTGIVGYRSTPRLFEFAIGDCGIGILNSLKSCADYSNITNDAVALRTALDLGESRFGRGSGHGTGFNSLFEGLANLKGVLRFRSGASSLIIDGIGPNLLQAAIFERVPLKGFFASVACSP